MRFCRCGAKTKRTPCAKCAPYGRGTTEQRGYDRRWRTLRAKYLSEHPLCQDCIDRDLTTLATEVHHIVTIVEAPKLRLDWTNLVALCGRCHDERHSKTGKPPSHGGGVLVR